MKNFHLGKLILLYAVVSTFVSCSGKAKIKEGNTSARDVISNKVTDLYRNRKS